MPKPPKEISEDEKEKIRADLAAACARAQQLLRQSIADGLVDGYVGDDGTIVVEHAGVVVRGGRENRHERYHDVCLSRSRRQRAVRSSTLDATFGPSLEFSVCNSKIPCSRRRLGQWGRTRICFLREISDGCTPFDPIQACSPPPRRALHSGSLSFVAPLGQRLPSRTGEVLIL
jgi:hypothetical protein